MSCLNEQEFEELFYIVKEILALRSLRYIRDGRFIINKRLRIVCESFPASFDRSHEIATWKQVSWLEFERGFF